MECSVCGTNDELLYACRRCGENLCATHQGRGYHDCRPETGGWTPPGTRDTTPQERMAPARSETTASRQSSWRPEAQPSPNREKRRGDDAGVSPSAENVPDDADRPGYGPNRLRAVPVGRAESLSEWFRRQTYVSLSLKVGFIATLWSAFVFSTLAVGLSVVPV